MQLFDVQQDENTRDDGDVQQQPGKGKHVVRIALAGRRVLPQGGSTQRRIGRSDTASPTVTPTAAHFGPSSAIAHNDPNTVAPSTRARPTRSRASGSNSPSRRVVLDSKKRNCQRRAPLTANSIAITDWKY
jgi:hypothetical protein